MNRPAVFALVLLVTLPAAAQEVPQGTWKSYTELTSVRDAQLVGGEIVAATGGGLFRFALSGGGFRVSTNSEGLSTNDLTAVGLDGEGRVWVGGATGEVDVLESDGTQPRRISDIAQSSRVQKAIKAFATKGDTVFIVSDFGVSVFRTDRWEFGDTYANFTVQAAPAIRDAAVFRDSIWIASGVGLLVGWLGSTNLSAPTSWSVVPGSALPSTDVFDLAVMNDTLVVATAGGLSVNGGSGFQSVAAHFGRRIVRLEMQGPDLLIMRLESNQTTVYRLAHALDAGATVGPVYTWIGNDVVYDPATGAVWLATETEGLFELQAGSWMPRNPDAPRIPSFYQVAVDENGILWAGSGTGGSGRGFARFDPDATYGEGWKTFAVPEWPILRSNDYYKVNPIGGGIVWASSWGYGVVEVIGDSVVRRIDTRSVPSVASSVDKDSTYAVIGSVVSDEDGVLWMVNRTAVNGEVLAKLHPDGTMDYEKNPLAGGEGRFTSMVIDRYGTKWLANSEPEAKASTGLFYFNEDLVVEGTTTSGGWGQLTQNDGLPNNTVISLAIDNDGDVWVGTDLGVATFTAPRTPRSRRLSSFPLREQSIQTIAVDALNRKWVGTKEGVFVVSSDGARLLEQYTTANTNGALIDNDVWSIAIDQKRGIVYMGTTKGLSALWIAAVQAERSYTTLTVSPNPFIVPTSGTLSISNLVLNSAIKVLTVDGRLISEFEAQGGGRAFWDGRSSEGAYVPSGVYLIVAYADNGEQVTKGKVVVIRR